MPTANVNGTDLYYVSVGSGVPCLVLHGGLGVDHTVLHPWLDPLSHVLHLIYYDHRGNGRSGRPPPETLTLNQLAADADALAAFLGFDQVAVIGQSLGGFIALTLALTYPARVSHLVLMDTAPAFNYLDEVIANAARRGATDEMMAALRAPTPSDDEEFKRLLQIVWPLYFHNFDPSLAERQKAHVVFSACAAASSELFLPGYDVTPRLKDIHVPTLVVAGRDDFICPPRQAQLIRDGIPNSELAIFERSGHFPFLEEPETFFATIRNWLQRTL